MKRLIISLSLSVFLTGCVNSPLDYKKGVKHSHGKGVVWYSGNNIANNTHISQEPKKTAITNNVRVSSRASDYADKLVGGTNLKGAKFLGGRIWQDEPINSRYKIMNYEESFQYCSDLVHLGIDQWELPTLNDFEKLDNERSKLDYIANRKSSVAYYNTRSIGCTGGGFFSISKDECVHKVSLESDMGKSSRFSKANRKYKRSVRCVLNPNIYNKYESSGVTKKNQSKQEDKFYSVDYIDLENIIKGNTLILKSPRMCADKNSTKQCLAIALLKDNDKSITIYPDKKEVIIGEWGFTTYNFQSATKVGDIITLPTHSNSYPFSSLVKINSSGTIIKITHPIEKYIYDIFVQNGISNKFLKLAKSKSFKKIDITGRKTIGEALVDSVVKSIAKSVSETMKEGASSSSSYSFCSDDNKDTCYTNVRKVGSLIYFMCTKGIGKGNEQCVSTGAAYDTKYNYGVCNIPYSFKYMSFHEAANGECR